MSITKCVPLGTHVPFGISVNTWWNSVRDPEIIICRTGVVSPLLAETSYASLGGGSGICEAGISLLQKEEKQSIGYMDDDSFKKGEDPLDWKGKDFLEKFPDLGKIPIQGGVGYLFKFEKQQKEKDTESFIHDIWEWPDESDDEYIPRNGIWLLDRNGKFEILPAEDSMLEGQLLKKLVKHINLGATNLYYFFLEKTYDFFVPVYYALEMGLMPVINSGTWYLA